MFNSTCFIAKQLALDSPTVALSKSQHAQALSSTASFDSLPVELQVKIATYLPLSDGLRMRQVSRALCLSFSHTWLWLKRLNQYFPDWQPSLTPNEVQAVIDHKAYQALFVQLYHQHLGGLAFHLQLFFQAVLEEDIACIRPLLRNAPLVNASSNLGDTALHIAARYGRMSVLQLLLEYKANMDSENTKGQSPLHVAASYNQIYVIDSLLTAGAKLDKLDDEDKTPLHYAIALGYLNCAYLLLAKGANPHLHCAGWNALHTAVWHGQLALVKHLHQEGLSLHAYTAHDGCTPLHLAAWNNQLAVAEYLLENGAKVDRPNSDGFTALHLAERSQYSAMVKRLIQAGAKSLAKDNLGRTPLQLGSLYQCLRPEQATRVSSSMACV